MKFTKEEIVLAIQSGKDREVLNFLYKELYPKLERYILTNSGSKDDAKDIFQEAILVFYQNVVNNKYDRIHDITGFVLTVGKNSWINKSKRLNREVEIEKIEYYEELDASPLVNMIMNEKWEAYAALFNSIGEKCKNILTYSIYERRSMKEIMSLMGFPNENAAKTHNYRCKQRLVELVGENKSLIELLKV